MDTASKPETPAKFDPAKPPRICYKNGQSEQMPFRTLTITERERYIALLEERTTVGIVAFCAGRTLKWIDELTEECFDDLANWCFIANFRWVMARASRDPITATRIHPFAAAMDRLTAAHPELLAEEPTPTTASPSATPTTSSPTAASTSPAGTPSPTEPALAATVPSQSA